MATKSMGYDNPAYVAVHQDFMGSATGAAGTSSNKLIAFTACILKSVVAKISAAGTSADVMSLVQISGTTTTTTALGTTGSGATGFVYYPVPATAPVLSQGDQYYIQKGTDATLAYGTSICMERVVQPLANVTV